MKTKLLILIAILLALMYVTPAKAQFKLHFEFSQDKMVHTNKNAVYPNTGKVDYSIHTDNVWIIGARNKSVIIGLFKSGHENWFIYSDPGNRNATGFYFQHGLPLLNKINEKLLFSVGHRFKVIGEPIGEGIFQYYIPVANLEYEFINKGNFKSRVKAYVSHRYRCVVLGLGLNIEI